jgi:Flp pilus assembly pilin Flp
MAFWLCVTNAPGKPPLSKGTHTMKILARVNDLLRAREHGQTMAEYAVVLGVITIALVAVFQLLGNNVSAAITVIASRI